MNNNTLALKLPSKFYPLTSNVLDSLYQANLTASEWRLWTYLTLNNPWGDNYTTLPENWV